MQGCDGLDKQHVIAESYSTVPPKGRAHAFEDYPSLSENMLNFLLEISFFIMT